MVVINELVALLGLASLEYAIASASSVSLVIALQATQPFFLLLYAIILSLWFPKILKEEVNKGVLTNKLIAIALLAIGVFLVSQ